MASKKIVVTGGAGFIGSHLVDALCKKHEVIVIDNLSAGNIDNLKDSKDNITFHNKSILNQDLDEVLEGVEIIFHLAAQVNVRSSVKDPLYDMEVNGKGTLNLLEKSEDLEKFVYASSGGAVYGEPTYLPVDELHTTHPISPYGISKLIGEMYLNYYQENYGLNTTRLRYANVYGERQDPSGEAGVISIFMDKIFNNEPPIIFGDGEQTRDYVHVSDVVKANLLALKKDGTFNVGTGVETSVNHLIDIFSELSGKDIKAIHTEERAGEVRRIFLSIENTRKELKWSPAVDLRDGIRRTFDWFRSQQL